MANHLNTQPDEDDMLSNSERARLKTLLEAVPVPENLNERIKSRLRVAMLVDPCVNTRVEGREYAPLSENPTAEHRDASRQDATTIGLSIPSNATSASASYATASETSSATKAESELEFDAPGRLARTRRMILVLAMAAALSGLAFLFNQWRQPNEHAWLVQQCQSILNRWEDDNPANLEIDSNLAALPSSVREQLTRVTLRGTRSLAALGTKFNGTLFRLDAADGHSLILVRLADLPAVRGLNSRFSILPTPSGGWSLVALQVNNETYVLASECTEQQLMSYIRSPVVT